MNIKGHGAEALLFEILKSCGLNKSSEKILVRPVLTGYQAKAPQKKGKRKYSELTLKFGFDPTVFREPETIHYLGIDDLDIMCFVGIDKLRFTPEGWQLAREAEDNRAKILAKHTELKELLDDFLPKWKEAYGRAIAADKEEESK